MWKGNEQRRQTSLGFNVYRHGNVTRKSMYIYHKQTKMSLFFFGEQDGRTDSLWGLVPLGRGRMWKEGVGG
jgi:hypothetical protein